MKQVKVTKTESYTDSQGEHIVCKGKLILIYNNDLLPKTGMLGARTPIIISETERPSYGDGIELDCMVYDSYYKAIKDYNVGLSGYKILAMPENFSHKHLQAIADGKLIDGDEVYIGVDPKIHDADQRELDGSGIVKLGSNGHVKLFPIKKELTEETCLEIIKDELEKASVRKHICVNGFGYSQIERNIAERVVKLINNK